MNIKLYLSDKKASIVIQLLGISILTGFLLLTKIQSTDVLIIVLWWIMVSITYYTVDFSKKRAYFNKLLSVFEALDDKTLICEMLEKPYSNETELFFEIIKQSGYAMNNKIAELIKSQDEYRSYIEQWVHEVKLPISVIKLLIDKTDSPDNLSIAEENEKIERYVEQVMFYARSEKVEQDYFIHDMDLLSIVQKTIRKHRKQFIANHTLLEVCTNSEIVLSDGKWLEFIISQILDNAIKYSNGKNPKVKIDIEKNSNNVTLNISNNGIEIPPADLNRVFEKGFTGHNGRLRQSSTGIGLFLVMNLCNSLGHRVTIQSQNGLTTVKIIFSALNIFN